MKSFYIDPKTNISLIRSAPAFGDFRAFCSIIHGCEAVVQDEEFMCMPCTVSDDDDTDHGDGEASDEAP